MHSDLTSVRDLEELTDKQRRFLGGLAARIPRLIEAVKAGSSIALFKLGTRRLDDGRHVIDLGRAVGTSGKQKSRSKQPYAWMCPRISGFTCGSAEPGRSLLNGADRKNG